VNINFAVFDMSFNTIQQIHKNVLMQHIVDSTETLGFWPSQFDFIGAAGDYQLALDIRTPNDEAIGGYKFRFTVSSYSEKSVKMSGLILAKSIRPAEKQDTFYRNSLRVVPNPGKEFSRKQPIHVYFEIYNMDAGTNKRQSFTLRYNVRLLEERTKGLIRKIGRIFARSQPSISNQVERETTRPTSVEYIALDLGKNVPGIYELRVTTLVPGTQDSVSRKINFELK
jgi:hypothetical protein